MFSFFPPCGILHSNTRRLAHMNIHSNCSVTNSYVVHQEAKRITFLRAFSTVPTLTEESRLVFTRELRSIMQTWGCCLKKVFKESAPGGPAFIKLPPSRFLKQPQGLCWKFMYDEFSQTHPSCQVSEFAEGWGKKVSQEAFPTSWSSPTSI